MRTLYLHINMLNKAMEDLKLACKPALIVKHLIYKHSICHTSKELI